MAQVEQAWQVGHIYIQRVWRLPNSIAAIKANALLTGWR